MDEKNTQNPNIDSSVNTGTNTTGTTTNASDTNNSQNATTSQTSIDNSSQSNQSLQTANDSQTQTGLNSSPIPDATRQKYAYLESENAKYKKYGKAEELEQKIKQAEAFNVLLSDLKSDPVLYENMRQARAKQGDLWPSYQELVGNNQQNNTNINSATQVNNLNVNDLKNQLKQELRSETIAEQQLNKYYEKRIDLDPRKIADPVLLEKAKSEMERKIPLVDALMKVNPELTLDQALEKADQVLGMDEQLKKAQQTGELIGKAQAFGIGSMSSNVGSSSNTNSQPSLRDKLSDSYKAHYDNLKAREGYAFAEKYAQKVLQDQL